MLGTNANLRNKGDVLLPRPDVRPGKVLFAQLHPAPEVDAPNITLGIEAKLREGDGHFNRPPILQALDLDFPRGVPGRVTASSAFLSKALVDNVHVPLCRQRVREEGVGVPLVVEGVQVDRDVVV